MAGQVSAPLPRWALTRGEVRAPTLTVGRNLECFGEGDCLSKSAGVVTTSP